MNITLAPAMGNRKTKFPLRYSGMTSFQTTWDI